METFCGETEESSDDVSGRKRSRIKSLRTRLFGKSKRAGEDEKAKLSQSESDITAGKGLGSDEDLVCSQGMMGSRALSHDSIFWADQVLTDVEPARILSQDNVHSKIKALQVKLQQQKLHLGPPPLVLSIKRADLESGCRDESLSTSLPNNSGVDITTSPTFDKAIYQPLPLPFLVSPKLPLTKSVSQPPSHPPCPSVTSTRTTSEPPLDFSSPAEFTACLDTSAARHRVSIKPRKQRASTKKRLHTGDSDCHLPARNDTEPVPEEDVVMEEKVAFDIEQNEADHPVTSQCVSEPEFPSKSWSLTLQDQALLERLPSIPRPVLRVKPQRPGDDTDTRRPHSSFIPSEGKSKREVTFEEEVLCEKKNTLNQAGGPESSTEPPSEVGPSIRGIKRPSPGSGSFHFSITTTRNRDVERPRSGSFVGVLEQARWRTEARSCSSMKEVQPRGSHCPGGAQHKSSVLPWDKREHQRKTEPASSFPSVTTETAAEEVEEPERRQKMVREPVGEQETDKEVKSAFGVKLRSTSQSMRLRSSNYTSKPAALGEDQRDDPKRHTREISESASSVSWNSSTCKDNQVSDPPPAEPRRGADSLSDPAPPVSPVRNNLPLTCHPLSTPTDLTSHPKEAQTSAQKPQPGPQTAPSEASWMSLAREKTRSLQQLFAGRFPRDLTGGQAPVHASKTEVLAGEPPQTGLSTEAANQASVQTKAKMSAPLQSTEEPPSKCHFYLATAELVSVRAHPQPTQAPLSPVQTESSQAQSLAQFYLCSGQQQQPSAWSDRGQAANKSTAAALSAGSTGSPVRDSPLVSASVRREREDFVQEKENASISGRHATWSGSVSTKAAFLEKQAQWTTLSGTKGLEVKKASAEEQMTEESTASPKITHPKKDVNSEEGRRLKPAESSPIKVPERPCEDKWLRKNVLSSPSSLPSPAVPPAFQSSSDSSQPSWMELAKRKSMAWSDKSMD